MGYCLCMMPDFYTDLNSRIFGVSSSSSFARNNLNDLSNGVLHVFFNLIFDPK